MQLLSYNKYSSKDGQISKVDEEIGLHKVQTQIFRGINRL